MSIEDMLSVPAAWARADWLTRLAARISPGDSEVLRARANMLGFANKPESAAEAIEKALKIDPKAADLWNQLGGISGQLGKYNQCEQAYTKAIDLIRNKEPIDWELLIYYYGNRAYLYNVLKNYPKAVADLKLSFQALEKKVLEAPTLDSITILADRGGFILKEIIQAGDCQTGLEISRKLYELLIGISEHDPSMSAYTGQYQPIFRIF